MTFGRKRACDGTMPAGEDTLLVLESEGVQPMPQLPSGTVTFLLTDIEGSSHLWEQHPAAMQTALARHDALLSSVVALHGGFVIKSRGEGDSLFAVFARASDAVAAALTGQRALTSEPWPLPQPLRVRMALHTGEAELRDSDYYGSPVNRAARIRSAAEPDQKGV